MKIAHINNIANVAWRLAQAQRRLGHEATVFVLENPSFAFPYDVSLGGRTGPASWNLAMLLNTRKFLTYDVLHFHGGVRRSQLYFPLFRRAFPRKTLAVHFHGSESRLGEGLNYLGSADLRFHSTVDLAQYVDGSVWIPNPIDLPDLPPDSKNTVPRFGHFPSRRSMKGTAQIIQMFRDAFGPVERGGDPSIDRFRAKDAELWVVSGLPHHEVLQIMSECEAVIDSINPHGGYGVVGIEGMALGRPVLGTFRPDWYPGCPIVPLSVQTSQEQLRQVAFDEGFRKERGCAGRAYVARVHDADLVARRVMRAYYEARREPPFTPTETRSYWRTRGTSYARELAIHPERERYEAQARELATVLKSIPHQSVLELGCGFGRIGDRLTSQGTGSWVGADLSMDQLRRARERPRLRSRLILATVASLPVRDAVFDAVLSVEMLMHVHPDLLDASAREMWRAARSRIIHLDWYEDFLLGFGTGWCWVHDYPALWRRFGGVVHEVKVVSTKLQSIFVVEKPNQAGFSHPTKPTI